MKNYYLVANYHGRAIMLTAQAENLEKAKEELDLNTSESIILTEKEVLDFLRKVNYPYGNYCMLTIGLNPNKERRIYVNWANTDSREEAVEELTSNMSFSEILLDLNELNQIKQDAESLNLYKKLEKEINKKKQKSI